MTRIAFFFNRDENYYVKYNNRFFSLSVFYTRLLNEKYPDCNLKFINILFRSEKIYIKFPLLKRYYTHKYKQVLEYNDVFDFDFFSAMTFINQDTFIWKRVFEVLRESAKEVKNIKLLEAVEYAYYEGLKRNLNADFKTLVTNFIYNSESLEAALWIIFKDDIMSSVLKIEREGIVIFEKIIESVTSGNEFFLVMYKKIEFDSGTLIIKGHRDVDYLPLKFYLNRL